MGTPQIVFYAQLTTEEVFFLPRHSRGHKINPTKINFRANIEVLKKLGVTDIVSVSAVGSLQGAFITRIVCYR